MKTSKKLLLAATGAFIALFILCLIVLRNDLRLYTAELNKKYTTVPAGTFDALDLSANWVVKVKQGSECKLELAMGEDSTLKQRLETIDGTLYLRPDTLNGKTNSAAIVARLTMPSLKRIKAGSGAKIHLENFTSDSVHVLLDKAGDFTGKNNKFAYISFKTTGEAQLEFTDTRK